MPQPPNNTEEVATQSVAVAIDAPINHTFDYAIGALAEAPQAGTRVRVPFGRSTRTGLVWGPGDPAQAQRVELKPISKVLDDKPLFSTSDMKLLKFAASYYQHPAGEVAAAAMPPMIRSGKQAPLAEQFCVLSEAGREAMSEQLAKRAPKQFALLDYLAAHEAGISAAQLTEHMPQWRRHAKRLSENGWLSIESRAVQTQWICGEAQAAPHEANAEQQAALDAINANAGKFAVHLLDGVTGSGKTEIYLSLIQRCIEAGKQALVLVPEIGLTPQLARRFERRLGVRPALLHSGLNDTERTRAWLGAQDGSAPLIVGTRSAVFTPLANPGLIIVDEEHDPSLKQQEGFRYHARDLAIVRARNQNVPIILGSATPALETLHNAKLGRYQHLHLTQRAGGALAPTIQVIDMNRFNSIEGISAPVLDAIRAHTDEGQQVLIYLNRRGYAPTLICTDCGSIVDCENCDAHMTVHSRHRQLRCHHCGAQRALPEHCSQCDAPVKALGEGTERVEQVIAEHFPDLDIARIDSDTTQKRGSMDAALAAARDGQTRIMIGTQMLAKGHHFPNLTLVVVINADQGFFASDFRAPERLAQSLLQVAGRAGRAQHRGTVLIQSAFADHPLLKTLIQSGYHEFAEQMLAEREASGWPPFSHIALLHAAAADADKAQAFLTNAADTLKGLAVTVLGPVPASMPRRAGRYRYQLLLQAPTRAQLHQGLATLNHALSSQRADRSVRWSLDVDPLDLGS